VKAALWCESGLLRLFRAPVRAYTSPTLRGGSWVGARGPRVPRGYATLHPNPETLETKARGAEQAAQSLQAWTLNEPRSSPGHSPQGSDASIGMQRMPAYSQGGSGHMMMGSPMGDDGFTNPEDHLAASSSPPPQQQPAYSAVPGSPGAAAAVGGGEGGAQPVRARPVLPQIPQEKLEFLPPLQRTTLTRQLHNQKNQQATPCTRLPATGSLHPAPCTKCHMPHTKLPNPKERAGCESGGGECRTASRGPVAAPARSQAHHPCPRARLLLRVSGAAAHPWGRAL